MMALWLRLPILVRTTVPLGLLTLGSWSLFPHLPWGLNTLIGAGAYGSLYVIAVSVLRIQRFFYRMRVWYWAGVARVYPIREYPLPGAKQQTSERQLKAAREAIHALGKNERHLKLLLASGFRFIGFDTAPGLLFPGLNTRLGFTLEVLLLDPDFAAARAEQEGLSPDEWKAGVDAVLLTLRRWRDMNNAHVSVWFYHEDPIWQMILTGRELWLFCARETPSDRSPIYCLDRKAGYGLAWGLEAVWERRLRGAVPVDLDAVAGNPWRRVRSISND